MHTDGEPLWDIVEEHLDEAEFLWERWEHGLVAPNYTLSELADGPEERLMAHLDGLVVNGPRVAERLLIPTIADLDAEPTRVCAAALALLQSPGEAGVHAVLAAFHEAPLQRDELARALECSDRPDLLPRISALLTSPDLDLRHSAARIMAFHDASFTDAIPTLLASERTLDRALGLRLAARLPGETRHLHELRASLRSDDPELRDVALGSAALLGLPEAWTRARELVQSQDPTAGHALLLLALRGEPADAPLLLAAAEAEATRNPGLWALGFLGTAMVVAHKTGSGLTLTMMVPALAALAVVRSEEGSALTAVPYTQAYREEMEAVSTGLGEAAVVVVRDCSGLEVNVPSAAVFLPVP